MYIAIDGNEANVKKRVGISEYAYWLLQYFSEFTQEKSDLKFDVFLKNKPLQALPDQSTQWTYDVFGPSRFWTQFALPLHLYINRNRPTVFLSLSHYAPRFSPVPTVVSVMDLSYLYFPQLFKKSDLYQLKNWTSYSVRKARKVLTISNSSRNDIIKEYGIPEENVVTVYPGIKDFMSLTPHIYGMNQLKAKYHLEDDFFLFVGTIQPRKNIARLIEAFAQVLKNKKTQKEIQLVIVGKKGWLYEEILEKPRKLGIERHVKFLETVTDEELTILYRHAICFVLPSLYEGFGLPVLEAMKYQCPVITSNVSSLPEAGGDAALYIDPENVSDITDKMLLLLDNKKLCEELKDKGLKQVKKFNWEKTARETLAVLEEVANEKR